MTRILLRDEHYNFNRLWQNFVAEILLQTNPRRTMEQILYQDYRAKIYVDDRTEYILFKDPRLATLFTLRFS